MKLFTRCALAIAIAAPIFAADANSSSAKATQDFMKHWTVARGLTIAVAEAMPDDKYDFKPVPPEMSFGEQMVHIAAANYSYCARMSGSKSPYVKPEKSDKATAVKLLGESFDYCATQVQGASDPDMMRGPMDVREIMLGAYAHMAHHRGQAEVYLRLNNVTPPQYKF